MQPSGPRPAQPNGLISRLSDLAPPFICKACSGPMFGRIGRRSLPSTRETSLNESSTHSLARMGDAVELRQGTRSIWGHRCPSHQRRKRLAMSDGSQGRIRRRHWPRRCQRRCSRAELPRKDSSFFFPPSLGGDERPLSRKNGYRVAAGQITKDCASGRHGDHLGRFERRRNGRCPSGGRPKRDGRLAARHLGNCEMTHRQELFSLLMLDPSLVDAEASGILRGSSCAVSIAQPWSGAPLFASPP